MSKRRLTKRLTLARESFGLNYNDAAKASGLAAQVIATFESGVAEPSVSELNALAKAYGRSMAWLLGDEEKSEPSVVRCNTDPACGALAATSDVDEASKVRLRCWGRKGDSLSLSSSASFATIRVSPCSTGFRLTLCDASACHTIALSVEQWRELVNAVHYHAEHDEWPSEASKITRRIAEIRSILFESEVGSIPNVQAAQWLLDDLENLLEKQDASEG